MAQALLDELTRLARRIGGELDWFADRMASLGPETTGAPHPLPVCEGLPARLGGIVPLTRPATEALIAAIPALHWTQSYTEADPGFDRHYLDNYGFVNLVSPRGLYLSEDMRVTVGFWGEGLHYPDHAHAPEEWYVILSGRCEMTSEGTGRREVTAGDVVHHRPWQRHAARMTPGPLLAAAYWRGENLMAKSDLGDTG